MAAAGGMTGRLLIVTLTTLVVLKCLEACDKEDARGCDLFIEGRKYLCYDENIRQDCCGTCSHHNTGLSNCEYGDRSPGRCDAGDLNCNDPNDSYDCCETCHGSKRRKRSNQDVAPLPTRADSMTTTSATVEERQADESTTEMVTADMVMNKQQPTATGTIPPGTVSYETSEPTATSTTTPPAAKEDPTTKGWREESELPVSAEVLQDDAGLTTVKLGYTGDTDVSLLNSGPTNKVLSSTESGLLAESGTRGEKPSAEISTVSLPRTISYETSEPAETTSTSTRTPTTTEDLTTKPTTSSVSEAGITDDTDSNLVDSSTTESVVHSTEDELLTEELTTPTNDATTTTKLPVASTVSLPRTISYETSEPAETTSTSTRTPTTTEDLTTKPTTSSVSEAGETDGTDRNLVGKSTTANVVRSTEGEQTTEELMTPIDEMTTTKLPDVSTVSLPRTVSYETSEPTETTSTSTRVPVTREDFTTKPLTASVSDATTTRSTDGRTYATGTDEPDTTSDSYITTDADLTTSPWVVSTNTELTTDDWNTDKSLTSAHTTSSEPTTGTTVALPKTVSYETSEPTKSTATTSSSTREDYTTRLYSTKEVTVTKGPVSTADLTSTVDVESTTAKSDLTTAYTTDERTTVQPTSQTTELDHITEITSTTEEVSTTTSPKTTTYKTEEPTKATTGGVTGLTPESTSSPLTSAKHQTEMVTDQVLSTTEEPAAKSTSDSAQTTIMWRTSQGKTGGPVALTTATELTTTTGLQNIATTSATETSTKVEMVTTARMASTTLNMATTLARNATDTNNSEMTETTVNKDGNTNPIAPPTTPLPLGCSERNLYNVCDKFVQSAPHLCYNATIREWCCPTCTSKVNIALGSGCSYGNQQPYCSNMNVSSCQIGLVTEHCCQLCFNEIRPGLTTTTPGQTTSTMETTTRSFNTTQGGSTVTSTERATATQQVQTTSTMETTRSFNTTQGGSTVTSTERTTATQQPTTTGNTIRGSEQQVQLGSGEFEGTSSVLLVVLPAVAVFIIILLVVLFVTIRHTSRVQRYLFQNNRPREADGAPLDIELELR